MNFKAVIFKQKALIFISDLEDMINAMPYKGDTESESQKLCLQNALSNFEHTVNGVKESDFKPNNDQ